MAQGEAPPHDYRTLDETIHGRVRLSVMAYLSGAGSADFATLKRQIGVTDGNLSIHLRKLEDAGFIRIEKTFEQRKPLTIANLTDAGREAWIAYLDGLRALVFEAGDAD